MASSSSSSSSKIHLLKKIAIEAGTPEDYYLNPSDNLWKMVSEWNVVEHEDVLVLSADLLGFGDLVYVDIQDGFINIDVETENKETGAARFNHKYGMKKFIIEIMNPKFLNLKVKDDRTLKLSYKAVHFQAQVEEMKKNVCVCRSRWYHKSVHY
ncbi:hypothetical protein C5167_002499 [Papaver somniferum]|uniref:Uncharacterized protein n=1 Tax=Papaver somniferum TaxID=3469 RepID=A0A4Y7L1Q8_PAPSO|nr:hypothetical protein C5167_002499 [Papaver somniferum]